MIHKLKELYRGATPIQSLVTYYALATVAAFILLSLPCFKNPGAKISFLDTLFMAISTISVTGLTTFPIEQVYNQGGVVLLEFLFQVGGFGITMLSTVALVIAGKRISLHQRQLIQFDMNQPRLSGMVRLVTSVFGLMIFVQIVFGVIFAAYFKATGVWTTWPTAFFHGIYVSVSSVTNAGFDVTGNSIIPFRHHYGFLFIVMILIIIGSIGYHGFDRVRKLGFLQIQQADDEAQIPFFAVCQNGGLFCGLLFHRRHDPDLFFGNARNAVSPRLV